jgi:hypothetical protein
MASIRHALRVLQRSDVSQHDWHQGQILCNLSHASSPPQAHAVFIDFAATTQAIDVDIDVAVDHEKDDYGRCVAAITRESYPGVDMQAVCKYWDRDEMKRESWDACDVMLFSVVTDFSWESRSVDPYKFVYEEMN